MKLVKLVEYLKSIGTTEELIKEILPNIELNDIELFMENVLDINSNIKFLDRESIPDDIEIDVKGVRYTSFLPLYIAQEMVEECISAVGNKFSDLEIAKRLLDYAINDA